ncbi:unnamed protein product [Lepidochelys kempii]
MTQGHPQGALACPCGAPKAGSMAEWLLGEPCYQRISLPVESDLARLVQSWSCLTPGCWWEDEELPCRLTHFTTPTHPVSSGSYHGVDPRLVQRTTAAGSHSPRKTPRRSGIVGNPGGQG